MQDDDIRKINEFIHEMWKTLLPQGDIGESGFAINFTIGSDGRPRIQGFFTNNQQFEDVNAEIHEHENEYEIIVEAPGIGDPKYVKINSSNGGIEITAEKGELRYHKRSPIKRHVESPIIRVTPRLIIITLPFSS